MCPAKEYPWLPKEGQYVLVRLGSKRESALQIYKYTWLIVTVVLKICQWDDMKRREEE
jgi:hypothetical protein